MCMYLYIIMASIHKTNYVTAHLKIASEGQASTSSGSEFHLEIVLGKRSAEKRFV